MYRIYNGSIISNSVIVRYQGEKKGDSETLFWEEAWMGSMQKPIEFTS